jgi:hypothetical protein
MLLATLCYVKRDGHTLMESDHIFMPWIREGKFFSAKFVYEGDEMHRYNVVFHS